MINAFHPDYIKTHEPRMMSSIRVENNAIENGKLYGSKSKVTRESVHGKSVNTIDQFPKTTRKRK